METDEALIEEIQTDWLRMAKRGKEALAAYENRTDHHRGDTPSIVKLTDCDLRSLTRYVEKILRTHATLWAEAMLSVAIWFLREEIGINRIYYHTFDFGCRLKNISGNKPPRSLYTNLPAQFCFIKTGQAPLFLKQASNRSVKKMLGSQSAQFHLLDFSGGLS